MDLHGNPQGEHGRFEQILSQFLLKSLHIVLDSRVPSTRNQARIGEVKKSDKWFNLVLGDRPSVLDNLNFWHRNLMEPMNIDIVLVQDKPGSGLSSTVIERWIVQYESKRTSSSQVGDSSSYKKTYKKLIILLRSLYSMTKLLPAYKAFRKLSSSQSCDFELNYKVSSFSAPFSRTEEQLMKHYSFIPVDVQNGCFCLSVTYHENLLSEFNLETSACFPTEIITDYVGSPLADPMRSFPSMSLDKGVLPTSYPLRRTQSSTPGPFHRPHSWTSGVHRGISLAQNDRLRWTAGVHNGISLAQNERFLGSPSPPFSPPAYISESSPVNIPHSMNIRNSRYTSHNFSDPNRILLPPQSPRSTKHDSLSHEYPSGIRALKKPDAARAGETMFGSANLSPKISRDVKDDSGRFSSSDSPRIGFSRSSSRVSVQGDLDDPDFACPFVVDDVDSSSSLASQNLDKKAVGPESPAQAFFGTRKAQDSAVGALVQMLKTAPPLRQDTSCYSTTSSVKPDLEGEGITASFDLSAPRKISDALEELKAYKELKDVLLSKSALRNSES
ncbi:unnamed protein product [Cuscuta epithymum]|uniref:Autophagy-related protein 13 N-terminal domain-containing protein n=1 Tax=Cuscuta epithymum TaxID=186058 RepID=A0AAV0BZC5_9ASTE|nr:unnamed protein product [Cuscuta epithymum]